MAGEGAILRKAREEKGWSYKEVEASTKIRIRYLEAMENEEYDILPGPTYTKGFLRNYSRLLGLNPEEIVEYYNASLDTGPEPETHLPLTPIQSTPVWFKPIVLIAMAVFAVAVVFGITYFSKLNDRPPVSEYTTPIPSAPSSGEQNNGQSNMDEEEKTEEQPVQYEGLVAELSFNEDCWLQVKVDGVMVIDGMRNSGTTEMLQGTNLIEFVTIGNAGGLSITLNGKEIPPLGESRQPVWNYVISEETLKTL